MAKRKKKKKNWGYKKRIYKGIEFDSTWEITIARWLDSHNVIWQRDKIKTFKWVDKNKRNRKYIPDFYLPEHDVYLDPKNPYKLKYDLPKLKYVIKEHKITLHYGSMEKIKKEVKKLIK